MQDESAKRMTSLLSGRDYLTAVLQEHQALREEIKLRVNMRNGSMVAFGTCIAIIAGKMLFAEEPVNLESYSMKLVLLVFLPILWFLGFTIQVVLMEQVDRLGRVLAIIDRKAQLVFELVAEESVKNAIEGIGVKLQSEFSSIRDNSQRFWGAPLFWETHLRSQRRAKMVRFRWWDSQWRRNIPSFIAALGLSSFGPFILWKAGVIDSWDIVLWIGVYFVIAVVLAFLSTRSTFVGPMATRPFGTRSANGRA